MARVITPAGYKAQADAFKLVFEVEGRYVNDHHIIEHNGVYHLFYIDGEVGKHCYTPGNEVIIGHATSEDLYTWISHEPALVADPSIPWESAHIFAPFVIEKGGKFYMLYSGDTQTKAQSIGLAVSDDLWTWTRCEFNPVFRPSRSWAFWDPKEGCSGRDPHVIYHPDYGYIMYFVADMKHNPKQSAIGCAFSDNLVTWQDGGPVLVKNHSNLEAIACKTESPFVLERDGLWYLFYRHGNGTKFSISDSPVDWTGRDTFYFGPCHAAEILTRGGQWYVTHCGRAPHDIEHKNHRSRGLYIAPMHWEGWRPVITAE